MRSSLISVLVAVGITLLFSNNAKACSCRQPNAPPCEAYWEASAVFIGKVTNMTSIAVKEDGYDARQNQVHFLVEKAFRGVESPELDLFVAMTSCAYSFTKGEQYLVYAYRNEKENKLFTHTCSRTQLVSKAFEDLQYIGGLSGATPGARIYGDVSKYKTVDGLSVSDPIAQIKIRATISGKHFETVTDDKGEFSITGLQEGSYKIKFELPAGLTAHELEREIKVVERGCAMVKIAVETDGRLSGKVLDFKGQPLANAAFQLIPVGQTQKFHGGSASSNEQGLYEFNRLQPGRYVLGIRFDGQLTNQHRPFPRMYYPGVSDINQATFIDIGEGERIEKYDLKMPVPLKERTITGTLTWSDGRPATEVRFGYKVSEHDLHYPVKVDAAGRFAFTLYAGLNVLLQAQYEKGKGNYIYSPYVKALTTDEDEVINVTLPDK